MLRITTLKGNVAATAKSYYSKEDNYYNQEATTEWTGTLAYQLGLHGEVDTKVFEQLLNGVLPNGKDMGINGKTKHSEKRMGFDLTFSAPKSISIQGLIGNDIKLLKAHDTAVKNALQELEKYVMTRKKITGISHKENTSNAVFALFRHELSRATDPQIHTHAILMNITQRDDNEFRAISNENLFKILKEIDAIYKNELLKQIYKLGYEVRFTGKNNSFELAHITRKQIEAFSQRTQQIEIVAQNRGKNYQDLTSKEQRIIAEKSRDKKIKVDHTKLRDDWNTKAKEINLDLMPERKLELQTKAHEIIENKDNIAIRVIDWAINHHIERESTIKKSDILISAINQSQGKLSYLDIQKHINKLVVEGKIIESMPLYILEGSNSKEYKNKELIIKDIQIQNNLNLEKATEYFNQALLSGRLIKKDVMITTNQAIALENKILTLEKNNRNICMAIGINNNLDDTNLNQSQKNAVKAMLTTQNRYIAIQGDAGVGKSFALKTAIDKIKEKKYHVQVLAPYTKQVLSLKNDGLDNTKTLSSFLADKKRKINNNSIIVLDEAGIVSSKQMLTLMQIIEKAESRLILLGDTKQTQSIEAGKPFYELQKHGIETANITEIQRQKNQELKEIVQNIATNEIENSYKKLQNKQHIQEIKKDNLRHEMIAKEYTNSIINNEDIILIVGENKTRNHLNHLIRKNLGLTNNGIEIEALKNIDMTEAEKQDIKQYQVGNFLKLNDIVYEIQNIDYDNKNIALRNEKTNEKLSINLENIHTIYLQAYEKNLIEISIGELIKFTQNDKNKGIVNNDEFIVSKISENIILLKSNQDTNKTIAISKSELKHIDYSYTKTIHASQGLTADKTILELDYRSPTTSKNVYYVGVSRARHSVKIYTNDIEKTKIAVQKEQIKTSSLDIKKSLEIQI